MGGSPNDGAERSTGIRTGMRFKVTLNPITVRPNLPNRIGNVKQTGSGAPAPRPDPKIFRQQCTKLLELPRR